MKLSEYVAQFLAQCGAGKTRIYGVCGAGAMHLNDALVHHPGIQFIPMHHEQSASFAAEADARTTNQIGLVHVTAGPGVTNTVTGVACAWADSIPMLVLAGQVDSKTMMQGAPMRQLGVSEVDAVAIMKPITKYAATIREPRKVRQHLEQAIYLAKNGRPGPVFLEIPLDVQAAEINPPDLAGYIPARVPKADQTAKIQECLTDLASADRPVFIVGNGIHLSGAEKEFKKLLKFDVPILTSWNASDLIDSNHPNYIGRPGLIGDRAGNFAIQNADLIIAIGTRLSVPQIGHAPQMFAPDAKLIMVDISEVETNKPTIVADNAIVMDAKGFLTEFVALTDSLKLMPRGKRAEWLKRCRDWKKQYPVILPEYRTTKVGVNSYFFIERLAKQIADDAIIVTDVGTAFVGTMQSMPMTGRQRLFHTSGIAPMGCGLPGAIGASFASPGRQIICLCGDGGIMFNLQELQTIAQHKLPISIFVMCNDGYMTMQHTQNSHFNRESVSSHESGVACPNFCDVARAFNIWPERCDHQADLDAVLKSSLRSGRPSLTEIHMPHGQILMPRVQSRMENGKFVPMDIADLWPHLPRDEYASNMNNQTAKGSSDVVKRFDGQRQEILAAD